jgi:hypothetical protein
MYNKTWKEHMKHLGQVLSILEENQFYVKMSKCTFGKEEVEYLGYIISKDGAKVDPKKIKAITKWPRPKSISKLIRGFLRLVGYYRRFVNAVDVLMHTCRRELSPAHLVCPRRHNV